MIQASGAGISRMTVQAEHNIGSIEATNQFGVIFDATFSAAGSIGGISAGTISGVALARAAAAV